jgi:hypothetical protein
MAFRKEKKKLKKRKCFLLTLSVLCFFADRSHGLLVKDAALSAKFDCNKIKHLSRFGLIKDRNGKVFLNDAVDKDIYTTIAGRYLTGSAGIENAGDTVAENAASVNGHGNEVNYRNDNKRGETPGIDLPYPDEPAKFRENQGAGQDVYEPEKSLTRRYGPMINVHDEIDPNLLNGLDLGRNEAKLNIDAGSLVRDDVKKTGKNKRIKKTLSLKTRLWSGRNVPRTLFGALTEKTNENREAAQCSYSNDTFTGRLQNNINRLKKDNITAVKKGAVLYSGPDHDDRSNSHLSKITIDNQHNYSALGDDAYSIGAHQKLMPGRKAAVTSPVINRKINIKHITKYVLGFFPDKEVAFKAVDLFSRRSDFLSSSMPIMALASRAASDKVKTRDRAVNPSTEQIPEPSLLTEQERHDLKVQERELRRLEREARAFSDTLMG